VARFTEHAALGHWAACRCEEPATEVISANNGCDSGKKWASHAWKRTLLPMFDRSNGRRRADRVGASRIGGLGEGDGAATTDHRPRVGARSPSRPAQCRAAQTRPTRLTHDAGASTWCRHGQVHRRRSRDDAPEGSFVDDSRARGPATTFATPIGEKVVAQHFQPTVLQYFRELRAVVATSGRPGLTPRRSPR